MEPGPSHSKQDQRSIFESDAEVDDSDLQVAWSREIDKGNFKKPASYTNIRVLILRWEDKSSDLKVKGECDDLAKIFRMSFGYYVHEEKLDAYSKGRIKNKVLHKVAEFIDHQTDGPNTLLIVYYAGHARPGDHYGELKLHGQISENDTRDREKKLKDNLVWKSVEDQLNTSESDVLVILDCCYAGMAGRGERPRMFEYLAATGSHGLAPAPGPTSFTRALIWALGTLVEKQERFTTRSLHETIKKAPNFSADQKSAVYDRSSSSRGVIMLVRLNSVPRIVEYPEAKDEADSREGYTVTLHLEYDSRPLPKHIGLLAQSLVELYRDDPHGINRLRWGGLQHTRSVYKQRWITTVDKVRRRASGHKRPASFKLEPQKDVALQDTRKYPQTPNSEGAVTPDYLDHMHDHHVALHGQLSVLGSDSREYSVKIDLEDEHEAERDPETRKRPRLR